MLCSFRQNGPDVKSVFTCAEKTKEVMKRIKIVLAVTLSLCSLTVASQANLVLNGSFEAGGFVPNGQDTMDLAPGSTAITGWTVTTANLAWIGPANPFGLTASAGSYFLDLSGYHDNQPYGGVAASAAIATVSGQRYRVTFDLGSDYNYNTASPSVEVSVTGTPSSATFTAGPVNPSVLNRWESFGLVFTANSASTVISFAGVGADNQKYVGLDNVSLVAVPEPTTILAGALLLLPFGASTLRTSRRKQVS